MKSFSQFLAESQEINLARKIFPTLSHEAKEALNQWESTNWHNGDLSNSFRSKTGVINELTAAFEPVRQYLKSKYGTHITLYRGYIADGKYEGWRSGVLQSWTSDRHVARYFAGQTVYAGKRGFKRARSVGYKPITDKEAQEVIDNFSKRGFAKFDGHKYIVSKTNPKYYNIWQGKEFVTDGNTDEFADMVRNTQRDHDEYNTEKLANSRVITRDIPIDDIVWILNGLNCKEFIVRRQPD